MSYTLIERKQLSLGASSIEFTNIPQFYSDLVILSSARTDRGAIDIDGIGIEFNNITTGYTRKVFRGDGASVATFDSSSAFIGLSTAALSGANIFSNNVCYITNYASTTAKSFSYDSVLENNQTGAYQDMAAQLWNNSQPITSIRLFSATGNFNLVAGTTISIYGINRQQAIGKPKAIGGNITFANGYWVHTFNSSGSFSPLENLSRVECLVVAGGGGGGAADDQTGAGAGGGAGGFLTGSSSVAASAVIPVIVGAGGVRSPELVAAPTTPATNGSNSSIGFFSETLTAIGGGSGAYGGLNTQGGSNIGGNGGSGGGSARLGTISSGTAGQGFAGGTNSSTNLTAGGGGGADGVGQSSNSSITGNGGLGLSFSISGTSVFYAGGGGAGASPIQGITAPGLGGSGGGGNGGANSRGFDGQANTGGGGGGGSTDELDRADIGYGGGNGGSGVVIVRYLA
jgi:hypothetical protein